MGVGNFYGLAEEVAVELKKHLQLTATVINPTYISGLDTELLDELKETHDIVVTLEDGILEVGYGQMVAGYLGDAPIRVQTYGLDKAFMIAMKHQNY